MTEKCISPLLITNGYLLHEEKYLDDLVECGLKDISISLKAGNELQHESITKSKGFKEVLKGIKHSSERNILNSVAIVIDKSTSENLDELVEAAFSSGAPHATLGFCEATFASNGTVKIDISPEESVKAILRHYESIHKITSGNFTINQTLPSCIWPKDTLELLKSRDQISYACQVMTNTGIIFDTDGHIIPCNSLPDIKLGKFGVDFTDKQSFYEFVQNEIYPTFFDKIIEYPTNSCVNCDEFSPCAGGCPLRWFALNPDTVIRKGSVSL